MKFIAHRGNITGANPHNENNPEYVKLSLNTGIDAEIDIWKNKNKLYLGHEKPTYEINENWLLTYQSMLWLHAKNLEIIPVLYNLNLHWFYHETDKITLTSKGIIWPYIDVFIENGIINQPSNKSKFFTSKLYLTKSFYGICADNILEIQNNLK